SPSFGRYLQHEALVGRRKLDLTGEPAFRANVFGGEIQGIALDRLRRREQMLASRRDIDVAGGAYAGAAAFGENIVDCVAPRRLHRALAGFGSNLTPRSVRFDEDNVQHARRPLSNELAPAVDDQRLAGDEGGMGGGEEERRADHVVRPGSALDRAARDAVFRGVLDQIQAGFGEGEAGR